MDPSLSFQTLQLHGNQPDPAASQAVQVPIYASTAFTLIDGDHIERITTQGNPDKSYIYSRIGNPTNNAFEQRIAALEGGIAALSTSSGQAATLIAILAIMKAGDNVVLPYKLYGGTFQQFYSFFPRIGIQAKFVDSLDPADFEKEIDENTKAVLIESISNPILEVLDIQAFADMAHKHKIPLIVDNTFGCAGWLIRPIDHGADIVIASATKWIAGNGSVLGGAIISSGKFDFGASGKFPEFNEALPGYHGLVLSRDTGPAAFIVKARMETLRETGACLSPLSSFQLILGLETLSLRVDKQTANAKALAEWLAKHPAVAWVSHPSLPTHPTHEVAKKLLPRGSGGMLSFGLKGAPGTGQKFVDATKLAVHCANVGDARTLVIIPAATVQRQLSDEHLVKSGSPKDLIRVSIGIEDIKDIIADFEQAIAAVA